MNRIQFYPQQKITVEELKWLQNGYAKAIAELCTVLNPYDKPLGLIMHNSTSGSYPFSVSFSGSNISVSFDRLKIHKLITSNDAFEFTTCSKTFNWSTIVQNFTSGSDGWLTLCLVGDYNPIIDSVEVDQYIDSITTNRSSYLVVQQDGSVIAPYLTDQINENNITNFLRIYKTSSEFTKTSIQSSEQSSYLTNLNATDKVIFNENEIIVPIYKIYWNSLTQSLSSGSYILFYQPIFAAQTLTYTSAFESKIFTSGVTLQGAFDYLINVFSAYINELLNTSAVIASGAYSNASIIGSSVLLSGWAHNSNYSGLNTRHDI